MASDLWNVVLMASLPPSPSSRSQHTFSHQPIQRHGPAQTNSQPDADQLPSAHHSYGDDHELHDLQCFTPSPTQQHPTSDGPPGLHECLPSDWSRAFPRATWQLASTSPTTVWFRSPATTFSRRYEPFPLRRLLLVSCKLFSCSFPSCYGKPPMQNGFVGTLVLMGVGENVSLETLL